MTKIRDLYHKTKIFKLSDIQHSTVDAMKVHRIFVVLIVRFVILSDGQFDLSVSEEPYVKLLRGNRLTSVVNKKIFSESYDKSNFSFHENFKRLKIT